MITIPLLSNFEFVTAKIKKIRIPDVLNMGLISLFPLTTFLLLSSCSQLTDNNGDVIIQQYHPMTLSFKGPTTAETDEDNPFLNYLLTVEFEHETSKQKIRGFYAADGNSADTGADSGNTWQVRFTPELKGEWSYRAEFYIGDSIAIKSDLSEAQKIELPNDHGKFKVIENEKKLLDFRTRGRIIAKDGYLKFQDSDSYFLKVGTNSPENFLAYDGFDNTYRLSAAEREGEAKTDQVIHRYEPHIADWQPGDPFWQEDKGKGIIGAINYLSSKGMNSVYFLTLNIRGDGKDVWMYANPDDYSRFDVSKLAQWEILFTHMQSKGIILHFVIQETENETLLDKGNLGPFRKLYLLELISRFGHHPGLVWNLGEENGPAPWMGGAPFAQTDRQRKASAEFLKKNDPYNHPVVIHTLPNKETRSPVLDSLLGFKYLDGISLQQDDREKTAEVIIDLKSRSKSAGNEWLITMDEIGKWHTGAKADTADTNHPTLTRYVLWGSLLSGVAGVEWYFGANSLHNDLTSESWKERDQLWEITNHAKTFFKHYLPYWEMKPDHQLVSKNNGYCLAKPNVRYALYIPDCHEASIDLGNASGTYKIKWYNPLEGGPLQNGSLEQVTAGKVQSLGGPPSLAGNDWVVLLTKAE